MISFLNEITFIRILVLLSFLSGLIFLNFKNKTNRILLLVLLISAITEITFVLLMPNRMAQAYLYSVYFILHHSAWLLIIKKTTPNNNAFNFFALTFLLFSIINILFIEKDSVNGLTMVYGGLLYVLYYIYQSYTQLSKENLDFFKSDDFLLITAPTLFFIGFSFLFSFKNKLLNDTLVFGRFQFYQFISFFVNTVYYLLLILYVFKSRKTKNVIP